MSATQSNRTRQTISGLKTVSRFQPDISSQRGINNENEKLKKEAVERRKNRKATTNFFYDKVLEKPERNTIKLSTSQIKEIDENVNTGDDKKFEKVENSEKLENAHKNPLPKPNNHSMKKIDSKNKSIICWNCENVLLIGDDWDIVQCTYCNKINNIKGKNSELPFNNLDSRINHFETDIPYLFVIVICPYCGEQNKLHKGTQHMICYSCHHSSNVESQKSGDNKAKFHSAGSTLSSYNSNTVKFSDMISNQNTVGPSMSVPQIFHSPTNIPNLSPYYSTYNYGIDYYNNMYPYQYLPQYPFLNNFIPNAYYQNYFHNPVKNNLQNYHMKNRMKRNNPYSIDDIINENPYNDKDTRQAINKIKENLNKIQRDLGLGENNNRTDINKNYTSYKDSLEGLKDQIENNKSAKNEAIYKSLLLRK
jgi:hypothetical protein